MELLFRADKEEIFRVWWVLKRKREGLGAFDLESAKKIEYPAR